MQGGKQNRNSTTSSKNNKRRNGKTGAFVEVCAVVYISAKATTSKTPRATGSETAETKRKKSQSVVVRRSNDKTLVHNGEVGERWAL